MPGLSGGQKAYKLAIANVARAQTTRAAYFLRDVVPVLFNGVAKSGTIQSTIRIDLNTGDEPHRASFDFKGGSGFVPVPGQTVLIGHGTSDKREFAGRLIKVVRTVLRNDDRRPTYRCDAAGWLFDIDQSRVTPGFTLNSLAPRSILPYLLTVTSPNVASLGFTASKIDPALPVIDTFSMGPKERISEAIARLFRGLDATWYMDHLGDLHAFQTVNSLPAVPTTILSSSSQVWGVSYAPTDFSRVFTRAHVFGAIQNTLADVDFGNKMLVPIAAASILSNLTGTDDDILAGTTEQWLLDGHLVVGSLIYRPEQAFEPTITPGTFLDTTIGSNTMVVAARNVGSLRPMESPRWYDIAGQIIYASSVIGVYSASGGSISYAYAIPGSGPGAILSDIPTGTPITGVFNLIATSVPSPRFIPAGAPVQNMATRVNSAGVSYVQSLTTSAAYGLISRVFSDERLSPDGAADVALAALERGDPSQWQTFEFETREREYEIGGPVFVSVTSPAEPSGHSITGVFTAHDITVSGFGELTDTKGPIRSVTAGAVRKPTFWQVLQGV